MKILTLLLLAICFTTISCRKEFHAELCLEGELSPVTLGFYDYAWCGQYVDRIEWYLDGKLLNPENNGKAGVTVYLDEHKDYELRFILFKEKEGSLFGKEVQNEKVVNIKPKPSVIIDVVECEDSVVKSGNIFKVSLFKNAYELQDHLRTGSVQGVEFYTFEDYNSLGSTSTAYTVLNQVSFGEQLIYIQPKSNSTTGNLPYIMNNMMENNSSTNIDILNQKYQKHTQKVMELDQHLLDLITNQFYRKSQFNISPYPCWEGSELTFNIDGTWEFVPGTDWCSEGLTYTSGTYKFNDFDCSIYDVNYTPYLILENPSGTGLYPNGGLLHIDGVSQHDLEIQFQDSFGQNQTHLFRETQ